MTTPCPTPLSLASLLAYERGELEPLEEGRVEAHYFACQSCSDRLESLVHLGEAIAALVRKGAVTASVTEALLRRGEALGLRIRHYRVAPGAEVACTAAPDDDFVAIHLELPSEQQALAEADAERFDVAVRWTALDTGTVEDRVIDELAVDRKGSQIVLLFAGDQVREFPRSQWRMHIRADATGGAYQLGPYTLNHTPWDALAVRPDRA